MDPDVNQNDGVSTAPSFEEFVAARWAALVRTAHLLTGSPDSGADLVQETLTKAYARWDRVCRADVGCSPVGG